MGLEIETLHGSLLTSSYLGRTEGPEPSFFLLGLHRYCDGEISLIKSFPLSHLKTSVIVIEALLERGQGGSLAFCPHHADEDKWVQVFL